MGLYSFVAELFERGQVRVSASDAPDDGEPTRVGGLLLDFEREYCRDLPGDPPEIVLPAALWGATMLERACRFLVYRDVDAATIERELLAASPRAANPDGANPAVHYSVDLTFRFLPDLVRLARIASQQDPLVERLMVWARQWPLSSVGIGADVGPVDVGPIANHPCLLALYVDRVIAQRDLARLDDARVRDQVRQALGLFAELAPAVAAAVESYESPRVAP